VDFTGVVLAKLDGDARGGAALSVAKVTGRPIMFASVGEAVGDLEVFHPDRMASRILDMGDVLTLIEQAEKAFDHDQAAEMTRKFMEDEDFTFDDFLSQMAAIKKMGSLKAMLKMMPGMGEMRAQLDSLDEGEFDRVEAMVRSMTPFERTHPKQINGSRRARVARGSGVTVSEVNSLLGDSWQGRGEEGRQGSATQEGQERQPGQARPGGEGCGGQVVGGPRGGGQQRLRYAGWAGSGRAACGSRQCRPAEGLREILRQVGLPPPLRIRGWWPLPTVSRTRTRG